MIREEYTDQARAEDTAALYQAIKDFTKLVTPEYYNALEVISEDVIGVGMGEQGYYTSKDEIRKILGSVQKMPSGTEASKTKITVELENVDIRIFSPDCATINADIYVISETDGQAVSNGVKQFGSLSKKTGNWLFTVLNAVPLTLTEEGIESYPLAFADHALAQLKGELQTETFDLMNESFSGGILGTYIKENFPLYFANDAFIDMLGYERGEFELAFKDNTVLLSYQEDHEQMRLKSNEAISSEGDYSNRARWVKKDGSLIWVEFRSRKTKDDYGNDILINVVLDITEIVELQKRTEEQNETIMAGIEYASKIQTDLLPPDSAMVKAFADYAVIWKPRDVVGGDIYWMKQFEAGTVLCVTDCTGHGTPGALLTMLVVSALEAVVRPGNCHDTAETIWRLEQRLVDVFSVKADGSQEGRNDVRDGCDLAVLFIAADGNTTLSSGHTNVYVCDGKEVRRIKGQKLYVGEGRIKNKDEIKTVSIPANPDNKFYIASDGLSDQPGWETDEPFGYGTLGEIALANHAKPLKEIADIVWAAYEEHRGSVPCLDDFELVAFKPLRNR